MAESILKELEDESLLQSEPWIVKTSFTHPYKITRMMSMRRKNNEGWLGVGIAPGKHDRHWNRDLMADINEIVRRGYKVVVCLLQWKELHTLNIRDYPIVAQNQGLIFIHLPIRDMGVPLLDEIDCVIKDVSRLLQQNNNVLIHCRSGLGRAGLFIACLLCRYSCEPKDAIRYVRKWRPGSIQTAEQYDFVTAYDHHIHVPSV